MRIIFSFLSFFIILLSANGQDKKVKFVVKNIEIQGDKDSIYEIDYLIENNGTDSLYGPFRPLVNGCKIYNSFQLGAKIYFIDSLESSEEIEINLSTHIVTPEKKLIEPNKASLFKAYLMGYLLKKKGKYKVKLYMKYSKGSSGNIKFKETVSTWFYIRVK